MVHISEVYKDYRCRLAWDDQTGMHLIFLTQRARNPVEAERLIRGRWKVEDLHVKISLY